MRVAEDAADMAVASTARERAGGTAFAIAKRQFLTCGHVIKYLSGHGAKEVILDRHGKTTAAGFGSTGTMRR